MEESLRTRARDPSGLSVRRPRMPWLQLERMIQKAVRQVWGCVEHGSSLEDVVVRILAEELRKWCPLMERPHVLPTLRVFTSPQIPYLSRRTWAGYCSAREVTVPSTKSYYYALCHCTLLQSEPRCLTSNSVRQPRHLMHETQRQMMCRCSLKAENNGQQTDS